MSKKKINPNSYDSSNIKVLKGLDGIKENPAMYIGSTSEKGLHHLVRELLDNSVDEVLAGACTEIRVKITPENEVVVYDNGRGIPTEINKHTNVSSLETVFTFIHAGGKFDNQAYKVSGGLHGVGITAVNALSEYLEVTVKRSGKIHFLSFSYGEVKEKLKVIGSTSETGTKVKFKPNKDIFRETVIFNFEKISIWCEQLAFLNKNLKVIVTDLRGETRQKEFLFSGGIKDYVKIIQKEESLFEEIIYGDETLEEVSVEFALSYSVGFDNEFLFFCNNIQNLEGGTHEDGLRDALIREIKNYFKEFNFYEKNKDIIYNDIREGLTGIVSVKHFDPQYEGQTKTKLGNFEVRRIVSEVVGKIFSIFLFKNPDFAKKIVNKIILAKEARIDAKRAKEIVRKKFSLFSSSLIGKLAACSSKNPAEREFIIVEGDSAAGTLKMGRDRRIQAVFPVRGKIVNVEKNKNKNLFKVKEIRDLIIALGTGIGKEFDISKLNYHKVIIATDADPDGGHIKSLLLVFFFRYMNELFLNGNIYLAQPPLYQFRVKLKQGKKKIYYVSPIGSKKRLNKLREKWSGKDFVIKHYKGLGEMDEDQLWDTTIDPSRRILKRVTIFDILKAEEKVGLLMGDNVEVRRDFIMQNPKFFGIWEDGKTKTEDLFMKL